MTLNLWKYLEKKSDGRLKFQRTSHLVAADKSNAAKFDLSDRASDDFEKGQKYQNSYRLNSEKPFKIGPVDEIVKTVMINRLENETYNPDQCPQLCGQVASEIRKKILKLNFERYKIVVAVTIIEKSSQSLEANMGFLWDADRDNYSTHTLETQTFFAYCLVTGTYYE